jgi:DNA repair protein RecN (Recombination protein N)
MLTQLRIRDFAIVEALELELADRHDRGHRRNRRRQIHPGRRHRPAAGRPGRQRRDPPRRGTGRSQRRLRSGQLPAARAWLAERDLDGERECHLRRVVAGNGRSRNYINGVPQPAQALRELGELLVDIHGQHEHQSLLRRDAQRQLLDDYAGNQALAANWPSSYRSWSRLRQELRELQQASSERDARLDILRHHLRELAALNLAEGEVAELESEQRRLANASQLLDTGQRLLNYPDRRR